MWNCLFRAHQLIIVYSASLNIFDLSQICFDGASWCFSELSLLGYWYLSNIATIALPMCLPPPALYGPVLLYAPIPPFTCACPATFLYVPLYCAYLSTQTASGLIGLYMYNFMIAMIVKFNHYRIYYLFNNKNRDEKKVVCDGGWMWEIRIILLTRQQQDRRRAATGTQQERTVIEPLTRARESNTTILPPPSPSLSFLHHNPLNALAAGRRHACDNWSLSISFLFAVCTPVSVIWQSPCVFTGCPSPDRALCGHVGSSPPLSTQMQLKSKQNFRTQPIICTEMDSCGWR